MSNALDLIARYQRPVSFLNTQLTALYKLSESPPTDLATYFNPDRGIILIVGDGVHLRQPLSSFDIKEIQLDDFH